MASAPLGTGSPQPSLMFTGKQPGGASTGEPILQWLPQSKDGISAHFALQRSGYYPPAPAHEGLTTDSARSGSIGRHDVRGRATGRLVFATPSRMSPGSSRASATAETRELAASREVYAH